MPTRVNWELDDASCFGTAHQALSEERRRHTALSEPGHEELALDHVQVSCGNPTTLNSFLYFGPTKRSLDPKALQPGGGDRKLFERLQRRPRYVRHLCNAVREMSDRTRTRMKPLLGAVMFETSDQC